MTQTRTRNASWMKAEILPSLLILLVFALSYLPHITQFGFYKDDWHMIYNGHTFGSVRIWSAFVDDRPFMGRINRWTYEALGDAPLGWNLFAFGLRLGGVAAFYFLLRMLFPKNRAAVLGMTLIFAVYPGFLQQPNAATFQNHLLGYSLALVSIAFSTAALRLRPLPAVGLTLLALGCSAMYLRIYEYMIGLEGFRWLLAAYTLRQAKNLPWKKALLLGLAAMIPYILVAGQFLFWRFFIFKSDRPATNTDLLLAQYASAPLTMVAQIGVDWVRDFFEAVVLAWFVPLYNLWVTAKPADVFAALALGAAGGGIVWGAARFSALEGEAEGEWPRTALWIGAAGAAMAILPVLAAGRDIYFSFQFDRYTLHVTAAIALFIGGCLYLFLRPKARWLILSVLVGISIPTHFLNGIYWADFWKVQQSFWWQVAWRAPQIEDQTVLMALLPPGYRLAEDYEVFSPANLIYHPEEPEFKIYAEILNTATAFKLASGETSYRYIRAFESDRNFDLALLATWPDTASCVHWIDRDRLELSANESDLVFKAAPFSHIDRILPTGDPAVPMPVIFGPEPPRGWCYYYQKADLSRQQGDWENVKQIYQQVEDQQLAAVDPIEWLPFYQAFLATGDQEKAAQIGEFIRADQQTWLTYCVTTNQGDRRRQDPLSMDLCR